MTLIHSGPVELLSSVVAAVRDGGDMLKAEFHRRGGPRGSGGQAPIDAQVEDMLKLRLLAQLPCGWLGEETDPIASSDGDLWIVDPHDGTRDFLSGRRGSSISVALLRNGRPILGVVYSPLAPDDNGDLMSWAEGSILLRNGSEPGSLDVCEILTLALNADAGEYALHNHQTLPGIRVRAIPSPAYRLALAAVGEVDVAASLVAGLAPWDIAGGHALLVGAGKTLSDRRGRAIDYRRASFDGCVGGGQAAVQVVLAAELGVGRPQQKYTARTQQHVADASKLARAQGCLLGQFSGDALGSAVEFETRKSIRSRFPDGVRRIQDGGTWNLIAGQPTDDSELALGLARALVATGGFSPDAVGKAYVDWRWSAPFDIGGTTSAGIAAIEGRGTPYLDSQSNGALMRVSPIGIFASGNPELAARLAAQDAALTHPNPVCRAASSAYAAAIAAGIDGGDALQMTQAAHDQAGTGDGAERVRRRLSLAMQEGPPDFQQNMGWVLTAFQNAFFFLNSGASFEEAVVETVSSGGDTDTNGAICGALLGAKWGREAVPLQWRNAVLSCRPVAAKGIHHPRPATYWPDDALELAEALLAFAHS
jgi:ADP-ribosyl-[dinitrogen reductase] hydrolase